MAAPSTQELLTQWNWAPSLVLGILLFSAAYYYAIGPLRRNHRLGPPVGGGKIAWFVISDVILVIALLSPIDAIGDEYLFSVHMVQHLLLATIWPLCILLAMPAWLVRPIFRNRVAGPVAEFFTLPFVALLLFNLDLAAWHIPALYDLTLRNEGVHVLEHLTFLALGVLNFWPILSPIAEQRLSYPFQVLYLFADGMVMMVVAIVFTFAPIVLYPPYASAPRLWSISALSDQQFGGLIMWYPGNIPYAVLLCIAFYRWFDGGEAARPESQGITAPTTTIGPPLG